MAIFRNLWRWRKLQKELVEITFLVIDVDFSWGGIAMLEKGTSMEYFIEWRSCTTTLLTFLKDSFLRWVDPRADRTWRVLNRKGCSDGDGGVLLLLHHTLPNKWVRWWCWRPHHSHQNRSRGSGYQCRSHHKLAKLMDVLIKKEVWRWMGYKRKEGGRGGAGGPASIAFHITLPLQ